MIEFLQEHRKISFLKSLLMVCIADNFTENRSVELVRKVYDYGEFYFISFRFGKISCYFICQKSLLTQGTIEDFEKLFDGKIVRKD